jgi:predicted phosphoadenosine phosphosulfate sulfurtransferase
MKRVYSKDKDVYEATQERLSFIFENFERVYISFSGGKDSGLMLNLAIKFMREKGIKTKLGVQILDNEANYEHSLNFMHSILEKNLDILDVYWCCLPITLPCTVSSYMIDWQCWGNDDRERWIRPIPEKEYVVTYENHDFPFFKENMHYEDFWDGFAEWYSQGKTCANLIGIRTVESLNRFRAIMNEDKIMLKRKAWTKKNTDHTYNVYPMYDWRTEDVWTANAKYEFEYNKLYDIFYRAGVPVHSMRVASPFMSEAKSSLSMYRVIDPNAWARLHCRVQGANFLATYGKQLSYRSFKLPEGHTWKSFVKFLLATLPKEVAENFKRRFVQSLKYWGRTGRGVPQEVIKDLEKNNIKFYKNGVTPHGGNKLERVVIKTPPDHLDMLKCHNSTVTSWKRFALTILKNDHTCKYMGLAPTKEQAERQRAIVAKYKNIGAKK